jgi:hypothetical protein
MRLDLMRHEVPPFLRVCPLVFDSAVVEEHCQQSIWFRQSHKKFQYQQTLDYMLDSVS